MLILIFKYFVFVLFHGLTHCVGIEIELRSKFQLMFAVFAVAGLLLRRPRAFPFDVEEIGTETVHQRVEQSKTLNNTKKYLYEV